MRKLPQEEQDRGRALWVEGTVGAKALKLERA